MRGLTNLAGTILLVGLFVNALSSQFITIDVRGSAGMVRDVIGYLFTGGASADNRQRQYNPGSGRVDGYRRPIGQTVER